METIRLKVGPLHLTIKSNDILYMEGVCKVCMDIFSNRKTVNNESFNVLILINSYQSCKEFFIKSFNGIDAVKKFRNIIFVVPEKNKPVLSGLLQSQVGFVNINSDVEAFKNSLSHYINNDKKTIYVEKLTNIEKHIVFFIGTKKSKKEICSFLKMKELTLNVHLCNIKKKLFVKTMSELVLKCEIYLYVLCLI